MKKCIIYGILRVQPGNPADRYAPADFFVRTKGDLMERYKNLGGNSNVVAYEIGDK